MELIKEKELETYRHNATHVQQTAERIEITSPQTLTLATDVLSEVMGIKKRITQRKKEITDPLNRAITSVRDLFRPVESSLHDAEIAIKQKMADYRSEVEQERQTQAEKLQQRVERGTMKMTTAMRKMDELEAVDSTVDGSKGQVQFRTTKEVVVVEPEKVPAEYFVLDMVKVRRDALAGTDIPGVKVVEREVVAAK